MHPLDRAEQLEVRDPRGLLAALHRFPMDRAGKSPSDPLDSLRHLRKAVGHAMGVDSWTFEDR